MIKGHGEQIMKYTTENALKEIKRRAKVIRQKREKKITDILTMSSFFSLIALIAVISTYSSSKVSGLQTEYGAFILSAETGGYILAAVLGFVLGVSITLVIRHMKNKKMS